MRNPSLDVLRAVAIILVFAYHSEGFLVVSRFGWIGVDLFFVLSGFLVSGLLFREYQANQGVRPGRFLFRRALKIYPQFYVFIGVSLAIGLWKNRLPQIGQVASELVFVQNYWPGMWTHTWSLAIEEHFYLLLTFVIVLMARRGGADPFRALPKWIAAICVLLVVARTATWMFHPKISDELNVFPTHLRVDSLLAGVLAGYFHSFHGQALAAWMRRWAGWLPPVSMLLLSPVTFLTREDPFMVTIGFSLVAWAFLLLLLSVLYPAKPDKGAPSAMGRAMARQGQVSYAFYLWHALVLSGGDALKTYAAARGTAVPNVVLILLTFAGSLAMAFVTTHLIEIPALALRERFFPMSRRPSRSSPLVPMSPFPVPD